MLKLVNVTKDYKTANEVVHALKGIDIEFRDSEFVSILGQSGCGKTTLLNIIGGLDKYTSGDLIIDGISTKNYKDKDWDSYRNHHIGFIFQSYNLIGHLSVLANVELSLTISGINKKQRKERAIEALKKVGLEDQIYKKPNQLSGGQMQRVAIARAIVNNPDIILADEPTGALDSKTSVQIMEILKEISQDKLVIMVTHNPELADEYSTRIVKLKDGLIIDDSKPSKSRKHKEVKEAKTKRTAMSFITALSLSFKNLITKKTRTILTSIAGSIGIIGVALVLSLSNGFQNYIDKMQADTLSSYPLTIAQETMDLTTMVDSLNDNKTLQKYPGLKEVYINKVMDKLSNMYISNNITDEYVENVIEEIDKELINGISYQRGFKLNIFTNNGVMKQNIAGQDMYVQLTNNSIWQEMLANEEFIHSQYDILNEDGKLPSAKDEVAIVVDEYNRLTDATLMSLGLYTSGEEREKYTFDELMGLEFKVLTNDEMYIYNGSKYVVNGMSLNTNTLVTSDAYNRGLTLKVVGIIRAKDTTAMGSLSSGIAYSSMLTDYVMEKNNNSSLVTYLKANENIDPFTGLTYVESPNSDKIEEQYHKDCLKYGVITTPTSIKIYPKDFDSKTEIKEYLDAYNENKKDEEKIVYTDVMDIMVSTINTMIDTISYVLIAFTSISLVVSSLMIAIITYVSVIERTKEIGVLRSIGARKKDISRVFNAETFIIGLVAGLFGVCVTVLLNIPINMLLSSLVEGIGNIASLNIIHAIILVIISIGLTLISGFIPSKIAAKKDPVIALRSE